MTTGSNQTTSSNVVTAPSTPTNQQVANTHFGIDNDGNVVTIDNGVTTEDSYNVDVEGSYNSDDSTEVEVSGVHNTSNTTVDSNNGNTDSHDDNSVFKNSNNDNSVIRDSNNSTSTSSTSSSSSTNNAVTDSNNTDDHSVVYNITVIGDDLPEWLQYLGLTLGDELTTGQMAEVQEASSRESVFNFAEDIFNDLFPGHVETGLFQGYHARIYDSGQAFGVREGDSSGMVYYYDGQVDSEIIPVGTVHDHEYAAAVAGY